MDTTKLDKVSIGVSACLLGHQVRFDGGHKRDRFVVEEVAEHAALVPVCPEVELGLGTPRETVRLVRSRSEAAVRLMAPRSGADHTEAMTELVGRRVEQLQQRGLDGFVLKRSSPTCGMERVRVYDHDTGVQTKDGVGLFARILMERWPELPVEEEGRLNDPLLRELFFLRVFAYRRLGNLFSGPWSTRELVEHHTAEKLLLLAHDPAGYRELGRLVARAGSMDRELLRSEYTRRFMEAISRRASRGRHRNVMEHMTGFLRGEIHPEDRRDIDRAIADYHAGHVSLLVPLTLIAHHARRRDVQYLLGQRYLMPHPKELRLRTYV